MIHLQFPTIELVEKHWDELYSLLSLAVEHSNGEVSESSIKKQALDGDVLLCAVYDDSNLISVLAFEVVEFHTGKRVINIQLAGGSNLDDWMDVVDEASCLIARARDCSEVYIVGRPGWHKKLKHLGYGALHFILSKEVN